jgi:hypothetical protein
MMEIKPDQEKPDKFEKAVDEIKRLRLTKAKGKCILNLDGSGKIPSYEVQTIH